MDESPEITDCGDSAKNIVEFVEFLVEDFCHSDDISADEFGCGFEVAFAKLARDGHCGGTIVSGSCCCRCEKLVGDFGHRGDDHDGSKPGIAAALDD